MGSDNEATATINAISTLKAKYIYIQFTIKLGYNTIYYPISDY